jgi:glutaredoxin 3
MTIKQKNVIVYRTSTCPWCHKAMDWMKAHKIKFTSKDVGEDQKAIDEMIKKSNQMGVPVIDVEGTIIVGFNEAKLKKLLGVK